MPGWGLWQQWAGRETDFAVCAQVILCIAAAGGGGHEGGLAAGEGDVVEAAACCPDCTQGVYVPVCLCGLIG